MEIAALWYLAGNLFGAERPCRSWSASFNQIHSRSEYASSPRTRDIKQSLPPVITQPTEDQAIRVRYGLRMRPCQVHPIKPPSVRIVKAGQPGSFDTHLPYIHYTEYFLAFKSRLLMTLATSLYVFVTFLNIVAKNHCSLFPWLQLYIYTSALS